MTDVNLILFGMPKDFALINEIARYYGQKNGFNVEQVNTMEEVIQFLGLQGNAIFLFKIENKKDLTDAVGVLKSQKKLIKQGYLKPACITYVNSSKVEKILTKYGCVDQMETSITAKTLSFKIDFWARAISTLIKNDEANNALKMKKELNAANQSKSTDELVMSPALMLKSDIWLFKSNFDYKKILNRSLIKMLGPSPRAIHWVELEKQPGDIDPTWRLMLRNDDVGFIEEDGAWFFYGTKPEFDWKEMRWSFAGDSPHLYFYERTGSVYSRIKTGGGKTLIAENSDFALTKEKSILETCETNYEFQKSNEKQNSNENNVLGEVENDNLNTTSDDYKNKFEKFSNKENLDEKIYKFDKDLLNDDTLKKQNASQSLVHDDYLRGKSSTDKLDHNPLSGKSNTDHLDRGPLKGNSTTDNLGLSGKEARIGSDDLNFDPLSSKANNERINSNNAYDIRTDNLGRTKAKIDADEQVEKNSPSLGRKRIDRGIDSLGNPIDDDLDEFDENKLSIDELKRDRLKGKISQQDEDPKKKGKLSSKTGSKIQIGELNRESILEDDDEDYSGSFEDDLFQSKHQKGKGGVEEIRRDPLLGKIKNNSETDFEDDEFEEIPQKKKNKNIQELNRDPLGRKINNNSNDFVEDDFIQNDTVSKRKKINISEISRDGLLGDSELDDDFADDFEERAIKNPLGKKISINELDRDRDLDLNFDLENDLLDEFVEKDGQNKVNANKIKINELNREINLDDEFQDDEMSSSPKDQDKKRSLKQKISIDELDRDLLNDEEEIEELNHNLIEKNSNNKSNTNLGHIPNTNLLDDDNFDENQLVERTTKLKHQLNQESNEHSLKNRLDEKVNKNLQNMPTGDLQNPFGSKKNTPKINTSLDDDYARLGEKKPTAIKDTLSDDENLLPGMEIEVTKKDRENQLLELLQGGLTENAGVSENSKNKDKAIEDVAKAPVTGIPKNTTILNSESNVFKFPESDFTYESGEIKVTLRQDLKSGNTVTFLCKFDDFFEDELMLTAPKDSVDKNSKVLINLSLSYDKKKVDIESTGKIVEIDKSEDGPWDMLVIRLRDVNKKDFEELMALYAKRQESIHDFMSKARGY